MVNRCTASRIAHIVLALVLVPQVAIPQAATKNRPADLFGELYQRGLARQRTMHSLHARFTESTTSTLLTTPIIAHGTVLAAGPTRVVMAYTDPEPKTVAMDATTLTIAWTDRPEREQMNISEIQKRIDHYFTHASASELRSLFDVIAKPDPTRQQRDVIDMRPKRKQIAEGLAHLELWIDRDTDLLAQMRLTFPSGDTKTITLEDVAVNVPVTDEMFRVK